MNINFAQFKTLVANFVNRDPVSFVQGTGAGAINILDTVINGAKVRAQRDHDFVRTLGYAFGNLSLAGTNWETGLTDAPGGTALSVRQILSAHKYLIDGANFYPGKSYEFSLSPTKNRVLSEGVVHTDDSSLRGAGRVYIEGSKIYLTGTTSPVSVMFAVSKWLPDYSGDSDTDFFLTDYSDWFLLECVKTLNFYLKEDQRANISANAVAERWSSVMSAEARLTEGNHFLGDL